MSNDLESYRAVVESQPELDDSWFAEAIVKNRQGDPQAHSQILSCSMRIALAMAEMYAFDTGADPFDLLQDANSAVKKALKSFTGTTAEEYVRHVEATIEAKLEEVL